MKSIFLFIVTFLAPLSALPQQLEFSKDREGILLLENNQPRYFYQVTTNSKDGEYPRANYVHPLYGLNGEVLTEDFPDDHLHHHGIFWSWHQLYAEGKRVADPWLSENISWEVGRTKTQVKKGVATLDAEIFWIEQTDGKAVIKEDLTILFERLDKDAYTLLFDIKLTALVDSVAIGGSEDKKGYGGFSARLALPEDVEFNSNEGVVKAQNLPLKSGSWINVTGTFDPTRNRSSGIVIMGETEQLPSYQGWILRNKKSMQNMAFPGRVPIPIPKGESLEFRNQILVHRDLQKDEILEYYKIFSEEKSE